MAESIWKTIEQKMRITVPRYVKNIFTACGYDNFYTIATIEETDFVYFRQELIEGKVFKYFDGKLSEEDVLGDCTYSAKNFEFSRGHQKLILAVVKYVKEMMEKSGVEGFDSPKKPEKATKKSKNSKSESTADSKRQKVSTGGADLDLKTAVSEEQLLSDIKKHESELSRKAKSTLEGLLPLLYKKIIEETQNSEIGIGASLEQKDDAFKFVGHIICPICSKNIKAFNMMSADGIPTESWNSSNFDRHCTKIHLPQELKLKAEPNSKKPANGLTEITAAKGKEIGAAGSDEGKDADYDGKDIERNSEDKQEIVINIDATTTDLATGAIGELSTKESEDFSKLKVGDFIQLYIVDLETSQKQTKIAKVTKMTEHTVEAYFLEKSKLENSPANCYFIPTHKEVIILFKSGIVRILKCMSTSNEKELCFSDIVQESDLRMKHKGKPKAKPKMSLEATSDRKKYGLRKSDRKKNSVKEREKGWKY